MCRDYQKLKIQRMEVAEKENAQNMLEGDGRMRTSRCVLITGLKVGRPIRIPLILRREMHHGSKRTVPEPKQHGQ